MERRRGRRGPRNQKRTGVVRTSMTPLSTSRFAAVALAIGLLAGACGGTGSTTVAGPETTPNPTTQPEATPTPAPTPTSVEVDEIGLVELEAARTRWAADGSANYAYTVTESCECDDEARGPRRVTVAAGEATATYFGQPSTIAGQTAEQLFDMIEASIRRGVQNSVLYDETTGLPTEILLDVEALAVDGGLSMQLASFVSYDQLRADLADARGRWDAAGIRRYVVTYQEVCFCPQTVVSVTVEDGVIQDSEATGDWADQVQALRVEDMFDTIERAIDDGVFSISVSYDPETGHPVDYFIDVEEMMADEEFGVSVTDLEILDAGGA